MSQNDKLNREVEEAYKNFEDTFESMFRRFEEKKVFQEDQTKNMNQEVQESWPKDKKLYSSSWFYSSSKDLYPTIEEQVKLCRRIANQLSDDENKRSKGKNMFYKRVKRSSKWVHEGQGTKRTDEENDLNNNDQPIKLIKDEPPKLKLILNPNLEMKTVEGMKKKGIPFNEHNVVSPDVCANLVADLNSPDLNKGAALFLRRKEKSSDWIVKENETLLEQIRKEKQAKEEERKRELTPHDLFWQKRVGSDLQYQQQQQQQPQQSLAGYLIEEQRKQNQLESTLTSLLPRNPRGWVKPSYDYPDKFSMPSPQKPTIQPIQQQERELNGNYSFKLDTTKPTLLMPQFRDFNVKPRGFQRLF